MKRKNEANDERVAFRRKTLVEGVSTDTSLVGRYILMEGTVSHGYHAAMDPSTGGQLPWNAYFTAGGKTCKLKSVDPYASRDARFPSS